MGVPAQSSWSSVAQNEGSRGIDPRSEEFGDSFIQEFGRNRIVRRKVHRVALPARPHSPPFYTPANTSTLRLLRPIESCVARQGRLLIITDPSIYVLSHSFDLRFKFDCNSAGELIGRCAAGCHVPEKLCHCLVHSSSLLHSAPRCSGGA